MKLREFLTSKRTWTIIAGGVVSTLATLFPDKFQAMSGVIRALLGLG